MQGVRRSHLQHAWCAAGPVHLSHVYICRGAVQLLRLFLPSVWTILSTTFSLAPKAYILPHQSQWSTTPLIWELRILSTVGCDMPALCFRSCFHLLTVAKRFIVSKLVPRVTHLLSFHQTKSTFPLWSYWWSNAPRSSFCKFFACLPEQSSIQFNLMVLGVWYPRCCRCTKMYQFLEKLLNNTQWLFGSSPQSNL